MHALRVGFKFVLQCLLRMWVSSGFSKEIREGKRRAEKMREEQSTAEQCREERGREEKEEKRGDERS